MARRYARFPKAWLWLPLALLLTVLGALSQAWAEPWSFGIMADTQWGKADDGRNPNTVAVDAINQINRQFIQKGVKFVVAVGDLADRSKARDIGKPAMDTRATYVQALYNAGVGFFPLRGNHDDSAEAAAEFLRIFPQTGGGMQNGTPANAFVKTKDDARTKPAARSGAPFQVGARFSSPEGMQKGLSYAFTYRDATFVLLDQFTTPDGTARPIASQQPWMDRVLDERPAGTHAFVFSHKGLITPRHADGLFGPDPASEPAHRDTFIRNLAGKGVRHLFTGHDHMHDRSLVWTTDGVSAALTQVVCAGASSKFYLPAPPANDPRYNLPAFGRTLQMPLSQETETMGLYVVTIDGPRVSVDFYSASVRPARHRIRRTADISRTPRLKFSLRERFGTSLNGREFLVGPGESFAVVKDGNMRILSGRNDEAGKDGNDRPFWKAVNTGWSDAPEGASGRVLTLWGMAKALGDDRTAIYTLAMTPEPESGGAVQSGEEVFPTGKTSGNSDRKWIIATRDSSGRWVNATKISTFGGKTRYVRGPWRPEYGLGTYGFDREGNQAWAVLNRAGDFTLLHKPGP